jgi:ribosomal-protein-alanine N-acetyltransferase
MPLPLETERLLIRPVEPTDAAELHEAVYADPVTMRWIPSGPSDTVEASERRIARLIEHQQANGFSLWAVAERTSGRLVGDCGLLLVEWRGPEVELAYRLGREFWGRGYATEAGRACVRFGLGELGLDGVIAITDPAHTASRRVMEKIGMTFEGPARYYDRDLVRYAAIKP